MTVFEQDGTIPCLEERLPWKAEWFFSTDIHWSISHFFRGNILNIDI